MKNWINLSGLLLVLIAVACNAQKPVSKGSENHEIRGVVRDLRDTNIYLANYYGNKLYYNDTARVDSKGHFRFDGKPFNECGKYILLLPNNNRIELVIDDQETIDVEFDQDCRIENLKIKQSKNNQVFYEMVNFFTEKNQQRRPIDTALADSTMSEELKKPYREQLGKMNDEVIAFQKNLVAKNPDLLVSKLVKMSLEVEVPEAPADSTEEGKKVWRYYYYRNHYWDNIDLTDPRMIRDPGYHRLLDTYITKTLPQIPDTMTTEAAKLLQRVGNNQDGFKYICHMFTYNFETAKIMCMDEGFVYMVDNYYTKGKCDWVKEDKIQEMKKAADEKRHCLCGEIALDIILPDTSGTWQSMNALDAKYTLLVIWEATCGHCKKEVPEINELYKRWKDRGLKVFAVHNNLEVDKWKKFIRDENLEFINVCRNQEIMTQAVATDLIMQRKTTIESLNFHQYWDVNSTPKVYLMDKNHKIIAKGVGHEQLEELLERFESGNNTVGPMKETEFEDADEAPKNQRSPRGNK